jgi:hypothetical protein
MPATGSEGAPLPGEEGTTRASGGEAGVGAVRLGQRQRWGKDLTGGPQLSQQGDVEAGSYVAVKTTLNQSKQMSMANYTWFVEFDGQRFLVFKFDG